MNYLVDADVRSEGTKPRPARQLVEWLGAHDTQLVVNPVILAELEYGILLLPAGRKRNKLLDWLRGGVEKLNVIEIDAATGAVWAQLLADLKRNGRAMPIKDSLIAATARQHGLTVATRNVAGFRYAGLRLSIRLKVELNVGPGVERAGRRPAVGGVRGRENRALRRQTRALRDGAYQEALRKLYGKFLQPDLGLMSLEMVARGGAALEVVFFPAAFA